MADQFLAEIRIFGFNFPPTGWASCDGQLLPLSQNTALFSLLGTIYGGDGRSTFALPNLQGRAPMMHGQGPGLSLRDIGQEGGSDTVTLLESEIPSHSHTVRVSVADGPAELSDPNNGALGFSARPIYKTATGDSNMAPQALSIVGGSLPHNNLQPYLVLNFCIALQGIFPQRQ
jgi:microcystin-dependent protein